MKTAAEIEQTVDTDWCQRHPVLAAEIIDIVRNDRKILSQRIAELESALQSAVFALRSYQYGNSATDLAEEVADKCSAALARKEPT